MQGKDAGNHRASYAPWSILRDADHHLRQVVQSSAGAVGAGTYCTADRLRGHIAQIWQGQIMRIQRFAQLAQRSSRAHRGALVRAIHGDNAFVLAQRYQCVLRFDDTGRRVAGTDDARTSRSLSQSSNQGGYFVFRPWVVRGARMCRHAA